MSDLHCAATLLLAPASEVRALVPRLGGARVALVRCGTSPQAVRAAAEASAVLGVRVAQDRGLDAPEEVDAVLAGIADEHRGETVLVVLDHLDAVTEVAIDSDGWRRRHWPAG